MNDKITVDRDLFEALERDAVKLQCLIDFGVDNWEGYDLAMDAYRQEVSE